MPDLWPELVNRGMRSLLEAIWGYCLIVRCLWKTVINQEKPADVSPAVRLLDVPVVITQSQMFNTLHTFLSPWFTAGKASDWKLRFVRASARFNPRPQPETPTPFPPRVMGSYDNTTMTTVVCRTYWLIFVLQLEEMGKRRQLIRLSLKKQKRWHNDWRHVCNRKCPFYNSSVQKKKYGSW